MTSYIKNTRLPDFSLWKKMGNRRIPLDFYLEITARCNNDCRHCYINLPASDFKAKQTELSLEEISNIADQAVGMGAIWCLITGGEPLLRQDFAKIYLSLKRKGLLVSVFTNACLITHDHIDLFKKYPPRDIEVTVYGVTQQTYEGVTRRPGSYTAFQRGLNLLIENGIKVRLKAVAIRSNVNELPAIAEFCRQHTMDFFRFDPLLNLRHDQDPLRNKEIIEERLSSVEIVRIEQADEKRADALEKGCDKLIYTGSSHHECNHLFHCGAGNGSFVVSYDGVFRLCADLWDPLCTYNLRNGTLADAWDNFVPRVQDFRSDNRFYLDHCRNCPIINLCLWCPAHAQLETGAMDGFSEYFCELAHARAEAIQNRAGQAN
jgi:radical SAM protein with 4Fe4S-binding SPASM domain